MVDDESFSVSYAGEGTTMQEGMYWGVWLITFNKANKVLRIDVGDSSVQRFEAGSFVDAYPRDISDLVAAYLNLEEYDSKMRKQSDTFTMPRHLQGLLDIQPVELDPDPDA